MKTSHLKPILLTFVAGWLGTSSVLVADEKSPITWKKTVVEGKFRSEGVAVADVNKDGKNDVLVGDSWYEAPTWTKHDIRKPGDFGDGLHSYSKCMATWSADINGDGWDDQVVVGFPGDPALWYENPKGKDGYWPEHTIWHSACNETPLFTDLLGTGKPVLVMGWQPKGKDNEGQMAWFSPGDDPAKPWVMHPISEPSSAGDVIPGTFKFSHGLGAGDLNGDGRADVICTGGWWEQPEGAAKTTSSWKFHPRPDRRRHQRRRPSRPHHRQTLLVARQERARLRQTRLHLLVRGEQGSRRQDHLHSSPDRRTERHRNPVRRHRLQRRRQARRCDVEQEGGLHPRTSRAREVRPAQPPSSSGSRWPKAG